MDVFQTHRHSLPSMIFTVHGFERLSYTTPESDALQDINFRPNVTGTGQPGNIGIIIGTIDLEEDTASKFISHASKFLLIKLPFIHHRTVRHFIFQTRVSTTGH